MFNLDGMRDNDTEVIFDTWIEKLCKELTNFWKDFEK